MVLVSMMPQQQQQNSISTHRSRYVHNSSYGSKTISSSSSSVVGGGGSTGDTGSHYAVQLMGPPISGSSNNSSSSIGGGISAARYQGLDEKRTVKFVTAAAANTFSHIPSAVAHYAPQPARMSATSHQSSPSSIVGPPKQRTTCYATFPLSRSQHQHHHHHHHQPQPQHSPSLGYVKEAAAVAVSGSYTFAHAAGHPVGSAAAGVHTVAAAAAAAAAAKGHVYYNVPYTAMGASRGQKLEFKDRNGFVHNMSYVATTTSTPAQTPTGHPKRNWSGPGPRFESGTTAAVDGSGGGGLARDWQQQQTPGRQHYAIVSTTTMAP